MTMKKDAEQIFKPADMLKQIQETVVTVCDRTPGYIEHRKQDIQPGFIHLTFPTGRRR